jgi:predicted esterase
VAAQAPYASHTGREIGFSWGFATPGGDVPFGIRSHRATERYVLAVLEAVRSRYHVDESRIFLMGFSQGAGQAFSIGLKHPEIFRGVIPIGGWLDAGEHPLAARERQAKHGLFLVCHSPEDTMVQWQRSLEPARAYLERHGIRHAVLSYPGGHSIPEELARAIVAWIDDPKPLAPPLDAPEKAEEAPEEDEEK